MTICPIAKPKKLQCRSVLFQYPIREQFIFLALSGTLMLFDDLLDWRSREDGTMLTRCDFALSTSGWGGNGVASPGEA